MGEMTARLAHQVRTPLATALLYASQLKQADLRRDQHDCFVDRLLVGLRHLDHMVNDMLLYARGGQAGDEMVSAGELLERKPKALSGGQRQRVAVGRAIVRKPKAFLFDEPLSNLDAKLRVEMRTEIKKLHQRLGTTIVYVTHDQIEAMTLADRIAIMKDGMVQQFDTPNGVYANPANRFVAGFIGLDNLIPAQITGSGSKRLILPSRMTRWPGNPLSRRPPKLPCRSGRRSPWPNCSRKANSIGASTWARNLPAPRAASTWSATSRAFCAEIWACFNVALTCIDLSSYLDFLSAT